VWPQWASTPLIWVLVFRKYVEIQNVTQNTGNTNKFAREPAQDAPEAAFKLLETALGTYFRHLQKDVYPGGNQCHRRTYKIPSEAHALKSIWKMCNFIYCLSPSRLQNKTIKYTFRDETLHGRSLFRGRLCMQPRVNKLRKERNINLGGEITFQAATKRLSGDIDRE
jgi:hypothetical protein